jgi:hypothetical protein
MWGNFRIRRAKLFLIGILFIAVSCRKETDKIVDPEPKDSLNSQHSGLVFIPKEQYEKIQLIEEPLINARTTDKSVLPDSYMIANLLPVGD